LADVRRILGLEALLPGLRRVDLEVNYRCPRQVVERAVRLVEHNGERFAKTIRAGPAATGRLVLAADPSDETVRLERAIRTWPKDGSTGAVLARTNRELLPAVVVALRLSLPFRAPRIELLVDSPRVDELLETASSAVVQGEPLLITLGRVRDRAARDAETAELATAMLGWAAPYPDLAPSPPPSARSANDSLSCVATTRPSPSRPRTRRRGSNSITSSWSGWRAAASRARGPSAAGRTRSAPTRRNGASATSRGPGRDAR
jgi:hypothetical protein